MIYLTRRERFSAAHRIYRDEWDDEQNMEMPGKCSNPSWYGHNCELFVTVEGIPCKGNGLVMNLSGLSHIIRTVIIDNTSHRNENSGVSFMKGKAGITEKLAIALRDDLKPHIDSQEVKFHCIKLSKTENNFIEYYK